MPSKPKKSFLAKAVQDLKHYQDIDKVYEMYRGLVSKKHLKEKLYEIQKNTK